tara:strand:- start:2575 stop:2748 length:174 start_codon:yes stop_codon:yes gene_type:complete
MPNHCIDCDKPVDKNDYSKIMCSKCAESNFEPTTADEFNTPIGIGFHHKEIKKKEKK